MPVDISTPKSRFIKDGKRVESHRFIISHPQFEDSVAAALLQMQFELTRGSQVDNAGARHFQIAGALQFADTLRNLCETAEPQKQPAIPQLRHNA